MVSGELRRNAKARVVRNEQVVYENEVASLKHEKDDVREVRTGFECGIGIKDFADFQVGDQVECYVKQLSTDG